MTDYDEQSFKFLTENSADNFPLRPHTQVHLLLAVFLPFARKSSGRVPWPESFARGLRRSSCHHPEEHRRSQRARLRALQRCRSIFNRNGSLVWMEVSARIVIERKKLEDQLLAMAMTDGFTGFWRHSFVARSRARSQGLNFVFRASDRTAQRTHNLLTRSNSASSCAQRCGAFSLPYLFN